MKTENKREMIIDAYDAPLGRLASYAAKQALLGNKVIIVNCGECVVIGKPNTVIEEYNTLRRRGGSSQKGPFFPKHPERLVKRTIRGMLSYKQGRGKEAFKRIMCYTDVPSEYENAKRFSTESLKSKAIKLKDLSEKI